MQYLASLAGTSSSSGSAMGRLQAQQRLGGGGMGGIGMGMHGQASIGPLVSSGIVAAGSGGGGNYDIDMSSLRASGGGGKLKSDVGGQGQFGGTLGSNYATYKNFLNDNSEQDNGSSDHYHYNSNKAARAGQMLMHNNNNSSSNSYAPVSPRQNANDARRRDASGGSSKPSRHSGLKKFRNNNSINNNSNLADTGLGGGVGAGNSIMQAGNGGGGYLDDGIGFTRSSQILSSISHHVVGQNPEFQTHGHNSNNSNNINNNSSNSNSNNNSNNPYGNPLPLVGDKSAQHNHMQVQQLNYGEPRANQIYNNMTGSNTGGGRGGNRGGGLLDLNTTQIDFNVTQIGNNIQHQGMQNGTTGLSRRQQQQQQQILLQQTRAQQGGGISNPYNLQMIGGSNSNTSGNNSNAGSSGNHNNNNNNNNSNNNNSSGSNATIPNLVSMHQTLPLHSETHRQSACATIRGFKPGNPNWVNQDNFFITENIAGPVSVFGIFDGHGEHGHLVSRRCRENFIHHFISCSFDMKKTFHVMQTELSNCDIDCRCSGATCVIALYSGNKLIVGNCGDSRAILGRKSANGPLTALAVTNDHKPDRPEERKRILGVGGHLGCRQVMVNQPGRGPVSMPVGPCRIWYQHKGETLGLAMSRSLGDLVVHKSGCSAEPEIIEHTVDGEDLFAVIATDGVWDVMDNNQVVQLVHSFANKNDWNVQDASNAVTKYARSRWEKMSQMVDDITCIVVKLK